MRKNILAFGVAVAVLIIAVSGWVVFDKFFRGNTANPFATLISSEKKTPAAETTTPATTANPTTATTETAGEKALSEGDFEAAAAAFAKAAKSDSTDVASLVKLAEAQIGLNDYKQARSNLTAAEKLDATYSGIFIQRGRILLREEKFVEATREFAKATSGGNFWKGLMAAFFDKADEAKSLLAPLSDNGSHAIMEAYQEYAQYPDSPKLHIDTLLARAFNQLGEFELAIAKIKPVIASNPDYRDAWLLLGYAQFAKENYTAAKQSWETAYSLDTTKPETQYFLGLVNFELKDFANAEKLLLLAKENQFTPNGLDEKLAEAYFKQDKFREAATVLNDYLEKNPQAKIEEFIRAIYLYLEKLGEGKEAWNLAALAMQRYPENALAYNFAGWVSLRNKFLPEAKTQLEKAITLDKNLPWPHYNLGLYYEETGNLNAALDTYKATYNLDKAGSVGALAAASYNRLLDAQKK
ncbi:MAG: tetratricopeptide repeat protein [Candidatus Gracilibacteria bacterium]|nr:tetratricopeptide repeat protein [Candidatus Gracilibacteria bacterium]MDD5178914.1 tetratricopeptide repeat protein [Candidatus Gracilibacteria bacterium]